MRPVYPLNPRTRTGLNWPILASWGPQDGVDQVLMVMDELVHARGREEVHATLMGFGDSLEDLQAQATQLGLDDQVTFTGRVDRGDW